MTQCTEQSQRIILSLLLYFDTLDKRDRLRQAGISIFPAIVARVVKKILEKVFLFFRFKIWAFLLLACAAVGANSKLESYS